MAGAVLIAAALFFPWNVYFGVAIATTNWWLYGLLVVATLSALAAIAARYAEGSVQGGRFRISLALGFPYLLWILVFLGFALVQSIRYGGTGLTPPGIGPGVLLGLSGLLLALWAHGAGRDPERVCRVIGIASLALASAAVLFNLYWRLRFVVPGLTDAQTSKQSIVTVVAAILYGAVALAPVAVVSQWLSCRSRQSRFAVLALGVSILLAGATVWVLPAGRELDAFHGIAQNTSTAGVGFEGFIAWVAAAAIIFSGIPATGFAAELRSSWKRTARRSLALILLWCGGAALLRVIDIASAAVLDLPAPSYNSAALMAFDLAVALLAGWLTINGFQGSISTPIVVLLFGTLFTLSVARLVVGVALVPKVLPLSVKDTDSVFGNALAQQITSTFDVGLCFLALALLVAKALLFSGRLKPELPPAVGINRASASVSPRDRATEVLAESTSRFAAGTVYDGQTPDRARNESRT